MRNWLITGGCGFIGTRLITSLQKDGSNRICVLDDLSVGDRNDLSTVTKFVEVPNSSASEAFSSASGSEVALVIGDILDEKLAIAVTQHADVVVHLAAQTGVGPSVESPREDCHVNVLGTFNYLEGARHAGNCRFVFASSGALLGEVEKPPIHEELPSRPVSPYGASKLAGEGYCSTYFGSYGVETVALRFGNVYGPGSLHKNSLVAKFTRAALNGETLEIYGDGSQTRDFIYIDDLINAVLAAANTDGVGGERYQIATNRESTVSEVVNALCKTLKGQGVDEINVVHGEKRTGDVLRNFSDISKAKRELGWSPEYKLEEGLLETVRYFLGSTKS